MAEFNIKVRGIREAQKALYAYSQQLGDKVVASALMKGAALFAKQAKANAPAGDTGRLKRAIFYKRSKIHTGKLTGHKIGVYISVRRGKNKRDPRGAYYAGFQENGWTDRGGNKRHGKKYMYRAFMNQRDTASRLAIEAVKLGSDVVKRKVGLK